MNICATYSCSNNKLRKAFDTLIGKHKPCYNISKMGQVKCLDQSPLFAYATSENREGKVMKKKADEYLPTSGGPTAHEASIMINNS